MSHGSTFEQYTKELSQPKYKPLSYAEERSLLEQYKRGSEAAFNKLVLAHLRFVVYCLRDYKLPPEIDVMDIIQEGNLGLMKGIKRFDLSRKCRVFTYCVHWIRCNVSCILTKHNKTSGILDTGINWEMLEQEHKLDKGFFQVSEEGYEASEVAEDIVEYLSEILTSKELAVISLFFGLKPPYVVRTLQEVGSMMHMHLVRIHQIRDKALEKLRKETISELMR